MKPRSPLYDHTTPFRVIDAEEALAALGGRIVALGNFGAQKLVAAGEALRLHNLHGNTARRNRMLDIWVTPADLYSIELINAGKDGGEVLASAYEVFGEDLAETAFALVYDETGWAR